VGREWEKLRRASGGRVGNGVRGKVGKRQGRKGEKIGGTGVGREREK
jgi:hypothetical protein